MNVVPKSPKVKVRVLLNPKLKNHVNFRDHALGPPTSSAARLNGVLSVRGSDDVCPVICSDVAMLWEGHTLLVQQLHLQVTENETAFS